MALCAVNGKEKIGNCQLTICFDENVLRPEVSENHIVRMKILRYLKQFRCDSLDGLIIKKPSVFFLNSAQVKVQIALPHQVHYQIHLVLLMVYRVCMYLHNFVLKNGISHYLIDDLGFEANMMLNKVFLRNNFLCEFYIFVLLYIHFNSGAIKAFAEVLVGKDIVDLLKGKFL
jgi:hypothetical protein